MSGDYRTFAEYEALIAQAEAELAAARAAVPYSSRRKNEALAEVWRLRDQCCERYGREP